MKVCTCFVSLLLEYITCAFKVDDFLVLFINLFQVIDFNFLKPNHFLVNILHSCFSQYTKLFIKIYLYHIDVHYTLRTANQQPHFIPHTRLVLHRSHTKLAYCAAKDFHKSSEQQWIPRDLMALRSFSRAKLKNELLIRTDFSIILNSSSPLRHLFPFGFVFDRRSLFWNL